MKCALSYNVYTWYCLSFQSPSCRNKMIGTDDIALANIAEIFQGKHSVVVSFWWIFLVVMLVSRMYLLWQFTIGPLACLTVCRLTVFSFIIVVLSVLILNPTEAATSSMHWVLRVIVCIGYTEIVVPDHLHILSPPSSYRKSIESFTVHALPFDPVNIQGDDMHLCLCPVLTVNGSVSRPP